MRFGSLFSGIGGLDLGLERAGMECAWQVEIDPYRREVLKRHWPNVRRYEDVRDCKAAQEGAVDSRQLGGSGECYLEPVDLICGGFPCQDVSTAGKRAGLRAERSGLFFEFARIVGELRPKWFLVENVPGLYSSNEGKDFDTVIGTLAELGYGLAWRVLDSQYFGVPQRRRRVFIVGYLGGPCPPAVLFEREGGEGNPQEGGKAGQSIAHSLRASPRGVDEHTGTTYIANPLEAADGHHGRSSPRGDGADNLIAVSENIRAELRLTPYVRSLNKAGDKPGQGYPAVLSTPPNPDRVREITSLPRRLDSRPRAYRVHGEHSTAMTGDGIARAADEVDRARSLDSCGGYATNQGGNIIMGLEAQAKEKPCCSDGQRYAALGDAVTVSVAEWIGKRIISTDAAMHKEVGDA